MREYEAKIRQEIQNLESQNRFEEAIHPLENLLEYMGRQCRGGVCELGSRDTAGYVVEQDHLASTYMKVGKMEDAERVWNEAVENAHLVFGPSDPNYAGILTHYAQFKIAQENYEDALKLYALAKKTYQRTLGPFNVMTISCTNSTAHIYQLQGDFDKAIQLHQSVLDLLKKLQDTEVEQATTLSNIAHVYEQQKDYDNALRYRTSALEMFEKKLGKESENYIAEKQNICALMIQMGKFEDVQTDLEKLYKILESRYGINDQRTLTIKHNLDFVYKNLNIS